MLLTGWKFASAKQKHYTDNWGSDTLKFPSQWRVSCCFPLLGFWWPADGVVVLSTLSREWTVDNTMPTPTRPSEHLGKALLLLCLLGQLPRPQMTPHNQGTCLSFGITDTSLEPMVPHLLKDSLKRGGLRCCYCKNEVVLVHQKNIQLVFTGDCLHQPLEGGSRFA